MRLSPFTPIDRWRAPAPDPALVGWLGQWRYAHRGLHDGVSAIENSPTAFARAIAAGLGIECDIQRSRDGRAMVFHDWQLDRLTRERGAVVERDAAALSAVALAGGRDAIPTLDDLLARVAGAVPILIEIKSRRGMAIVPICRAVRNALQGYRGRFAVMSFDPRIPRWFAREMPQAPHGLVMTEGNARDAAGRVRRHLALWRARPAFLAYDIRDLPSAFAAAQRRRGLPVASWTVRDADQLARAAEHVDAPILEGAAAA